MRRAMLGMGLLGIASIGSVPLRRDVSERADAALEAIQKGDLERAEALLSGKRTVSVDFGASNRILLKTGLRPEVVSCTDARPKGRGQRRREAAARKGKK